MCARLGLTSLTFMWRQPQAALLEAMICSGIRAVLVKVAALGLVPRLHLGQALEEVQPILHRLCRCAQAEHLGTGF